MFIKLTHAETGKPAYVRTSAITAFYPGDIWKDNDTVDATWVSLQEEVVVGVSETPEEVFALIQQQAG